MTDTSADPPEGTERFENLDEALDETDLPGHGQGPEGGRDIDSDLVVDQEALREVGADLDDPDRMSILDGGMDDPDGSGPPPDPEPPESSEAEVSSEAEGDEPGLTDPESIVAANDAELEITEIDATEMDQVPDDAPGTDSARW
ncbi:MAG TPA: hypothetical protein VKI19_07890 [Acidimicrobiales bacterium]|nr:hypothetical protein [Acidimicrobiales bacterium]